MNDHRNDPPEDLIPECPAHCGGIGNELSQDDVGIHYECDECHIKWTEKWEVMEDDVG